MTMRAGVVGNPIEQSLSPAIHNAWIADLALDAEYRRFSCPIDGFAAFLAEARLSGLRGLNVTIPFKEQALVAADRKTPRALRAGAANVLTFSQGEVSADNTDGEGLLAAIEEQQPHFLVASGPAVILGAGGAARGAAAALCEVAPSVRVVNRTKVRAEALADQLGEGVEAYGWLEIKHALDGAALLVNATPVGMGDDAMPKFDMRWLPTGAVVMDMVYKPLMTPLLREADEWKHPIVDGLAMLIGQARPSFEAFFGRRPPQTNVRAIAEEAMA